jgi:hypothetical protein
MMLEFCLLLVVVVLFWPFFVYAAALAVFLGICAACLIAAAVLAVWVWSSGGFVGLASGLLAGGTVPGGRSSFSSIPCALAPG